VNRVTTKFYHRNKTVDIFTENRKKAGIENFKRLKKMTLMPGFWCASAHQVRKPFYFRFPEIEFYDGVTL
jgi:hypothetical protein